MTLKEKFEASGMTQEELARVIGKGVGTVCGIVNGNYKSANSKLYESALTNHLDRVLEKKIKPLNHEWLSLAQLKVRDRLNRMKSSNLSFLELVLGESGMGKSFMFERFFVNKEDIYIKARRNLSSSAFINLILRNLGVKPYGNSDDRLEMIFEAIKEQGVKLIVIDEADLFVRDNDYVFERKFEILREIFEYSKRLGLGVSVVAVGLGILRKRVDRMGGYLQSRFTYSPEMVLSDEELKKIGELNGVGVETSEYLSGGHNARLFEKTAANIALGYDEKVAANLVYTVRK